MNINELHAQIATGKKSLENELFSLLTARFLVFTRHRIRDRQNAEEVVQEAVKTIAEKYKDTQFTTSFSAWAYKVLENRMLAFFQNEKRKQQRAEKLQESDHPVGKPSVELNAELRQKLLACLEQLVSVNKRYARLLNLSHLGYSNKEIRDRMNLTSSNLYSILSRARVLLMECLQKGKITR